MSLKKKGGNALINKYLYLLKGGGIESVHSGKMHFYDNVSHPHTLGLTGKEKKVQV